MNKTVRSSRSAASSTSCARASTPTGSRSAFASCPGVTVHGMCKFLLLSTGPEFELYVTPINIDPEKPAMPVGYPSVYSVYLAKKARRLRHARPGGRHLGLERARPGDDHFLQQCLDTDREREAMFFDGLDKVRRGLCVCVFDGTDRMQHMFWRYHRRAAPRPPERSARQAPSPSKTSTGAWTTSSAGPWPNVRDKDTLLMVISDHGFNTFRRGIDLNRWLEENGYLVVDDGRRRRAPGRRRLVADARLRHRPDRYLHQRER